MWSGISLWFGSALTEVKLCFMTMCVFSLKKVKQWNHWELKFSISSLKTYPHCDSVLWFGKMLPLSKGHLGSLSIVS